jgi:Restriction Enzyme Adenine Methylase Associated/Type I restriction enzyme R protein N terminus (HSDR_N)
MEILPSVLTQIAHRIRSAGHHVTEEDTKGSLIDPVLRALDWDTEDWNEVRREYRTSPGANPVDYALLDSTSGKPLALVEAKALRETLDDARWAGQIMGYAHVVGAKWMILTDGRRYRVYNAYGQGPVEQKLFHSFDVVDDPSGAEEGLALVAKRSLLDGNADSKWVQHATNLTLTQAVDKILGPLPDPRFVKLVRQFAPEIAKRDVDAWLQGARLVRSESTPGTAATTPTEAKVRARGGEEGSQPASDAGKQAESGPLELRQLISDGAIRVPVEIEAIYKGRRLTATLQPDASILYDGRKFLSPSSAGGEAKRTVDGVARSTNGWTFWMFRGPNGELIPLSSLRSFPFS